MDHWKRENRESKDYTTFVYLCDCFVDSAPLEIPLRGTRAASEPSWCLPGKSGIHVGGHLGLTGLLGRDLRSLPCLIHHWLALPSTRRDHGHHGLLIFIVGRGGPATWQGGERGRCAMRQPTNTTSLPESMGVQEAVELHQRQGFCVRQPVRPSRAYSRASRRSLGSWGRSTQSATPAPRAVTRRRVICVAVPFHPPHPPSRSPIILVVRGTRTNELFHATPGPRKVPRGPRPAPRYVQAPRNGESLKYNFLVCQGSEALDHLDDALCRH